MGSLEVYTDGSCKQGQGSWAFVIVQNQKVILEKSGSQKNTNNLEMEYQAVIEALKVLPQNSNVKIYSDSRIIIDNVTIEMPVWKKQNWIKKNQREVPHANQLKQIDELMQNKNVSWKWVKAHSGVLFNERCDELCILARI